MREKFGTPTTANEFLIQQNVIGVTVVDNPVITGEGGGDGGAGGIIAGVVIAIIVVVAIAVGLYCFCKGRGGGGGGGKAPPGPPTLAGGLPARLEPGRRPGERAHLLRQREHRRNFVGDARRRRRPRAAVAPGGLAERGRPVERQDVLCQLDDWADLVGDAALRASCSPVWDKGSGKGRAGCKHAPSVKGG